MISLGKWFGFASQMYEAMKATKEAVFICHLLWRGLLQHRLAQANENSMHCCGLH